MAAILQINEVPDIEADTAAGKRNFAVRFGARGAAIAYFVMQLGAFALIALLAFTGQLPLVVVLVPAVLFVLGINATMTIAPAPGPNIVTGIKLTLVIQLLGCLWLTGALLLL